MKDSDGEEKEDRNVFNLLSQLRKEKLFVTTEKLNIQLLNETIKTKTDSLVESTWITTKQRLYLLSQREFSTQSYEYVNFMMNADFVEAKTVLGFQNAVKIENLLQTLRSQPEQFAKWLFRGRQLACNNLILQSIVTGLYSSCIFPEDTKNMLKLLYELAKLQLIKSDNPMRMLKNGSCSFRYLYFIFHEVLVPAKFFLSAALEIPILRLLSYNEYYLDLEPEKTLMRYKHDVNNVKSEFRDLAQYRCDVVIKLAEFTNSFISSLRDNVYSFPKSLSWLINQIAKFVTDTFGAKEANAVVTELIFTLYICPAIVDPEQYCICELQITDLARHNLMQVGQLLQKLALNKFEEFDAKIIDIYKLIDKDAITNFIDDVLYNLVYDDAETPMDCTPQIVRDSVLFAEDELNSLICFLQRIHNDDVGGVFKKNFGTIEEQIVSLSLPSSLDNSPKSNRPYTNGFTDTNSKRNVLSLVKKNHSSQNLTAEGGSLTVLVFSIEKITDPMGLLSEDKVLNMNIPVKKDVMFAPDIVENGHGDGKQSFNYHDEGSIGNTSDNLEAISEAASNHSVASSLELENEDQNDNLSDMVSANVSGRGTPNISGRDTPSSQVNEEERPLPEQRQAQPQVSRQIRSEIDDKFCKFEIKKLLEGDETISIISETWSTDVLASDNETVDAGDSRIERQNLAMGDQIINEVPTGNILDLSETQSESAWSTDVMTSDTERLTEVDNDDASSVAQSDDTNSVARSDDTRSETDDLPSRRLSNPSNCYTTNYSNYQEYRKLEIKNDVKIDNNANNLLYKTVTLTDGQMEVKTTSFTAIRTSNHHNQAGTSGSSNYLKQKFEEHPNDIILSNCSLNSSSSGSSSNSFENKTNETCENWEGKQWLNSSGSSLNVTSTPSESTSELSVLSVNNMTNQSVLTGKKVGTVLVGKSLKPSASTGAIPKSISFDMSADKGDKYFDDDHRSKRGGFFGKLRMGFRTRRGKSFRNQDDFRLDNNDFSVNHKVESPVKLNNLAVSEDILAKYRTKPFVEDTIKENNDNIKSLSKMPISDDSPQNIDVNNSFVDIKKKIRLVLSDSSSQIPAVIVENRLSVKHKIETVLRHELGKARKLKEWSNIARISEAIRCINLLNESTCLALLQSMKEDLMQRSVYTQYLICSRQELLFSESYVDGLNEQIMNEKQQCEEYLSSICVRTFLIEQEARITRFCEEFKELTLSDEKCDYLNNFYQQLYSIMQRRDLWQAIFKNRGDTIKATLERCIISKVYNFALYPNGDGDRDRDIVLRQHIEKLSKIISPDHKDLMINKSFLREFPWIPAQDALKAISAYRTPRDKVNCVVHCAKCIMDLLSLSQNAGSTTADDFTPVLVYVIIKVNPNHLLSTIQFVNSFYQNLCGEEHYWWTQFCAAIEFIKTMDYSD